VHKNLEKKQNALLGKIHLPKMWAGSELLAQTPRTEKAADVTADIPFVI